LINLGSKIVNGKELRYGFTTGTCATAAAKAAAIMLLNKITLREIEITTNSGRAISLPVENIFFEKKTVKCGIQKDSGDDPDITNGMFVFAEARLIEKGIKIKAGNGVGIVTKKGLAVSPGLPAINPGPMKMILNELKKVLLDNKGIEVILSIPGGEEIAKRTFNPKLGIEGGLSILGTSGIIEPMSVDAIKETHRLELNKFIEEGNKKIILVLGNYGNDFVKNILAINNFPVLKISNYIGDILLYAETKPVEEILIIGHIGKLIKLAGGIFNTHSKTADGRMEIFAAMAASVGLSEKSINNILETNTTDSAIEIVENEFPKEKQNELYNRIAKRVSDKAESYIHNSIKIGSLIFSLQKGELARCQNAETIIKENQ